MISWLIFLTFLFNLNVLAYYRMGAAVASIGVFFFVAAYFRPEVVPQYFGELVPNRKLLFYPTATATAATIEIGDSGTRIVWSGNPGEPIFQFFDGCQLTIEKIGKLVKVSTVFRDAHGSIVAELVRNQWKVAPPPNTWDRNYTSDALEVKNAQGQIILQIRALPDRVQIQGIWRGAGDSVFALSKNLDGKPGSSMLILPPGYNRPGMKPNIPPLFRYPSATHFGELLNAS